MLLVEVLRVELYTLSPPTRFSRILKTDSVKSWSFTTEFDGRPEGWDRTRFSERGQKKLEFFLYLCVPLSRKSKLIWNEPANGWIWDCGISIDERECTGSQLNESHSNQSELL